MEITTGQLNMLFPDLTAREVTRIKRNLESDWFLHWEDIANSTELLIDIPTDVWKTLLDHATEITQQQ